MIRNIFIYWAQGFPNAPLVVQKCVLSWKLRNPNWTLYEIDDSNITDYIDVSESIHDINKKDISKTGYSDIVRILLLEKYGGCWCDATTFCNVPLDEWLPASISSGFFAFSRSDAGPNIKTSSWFLYGELNNYIVTAWKNDIVLFWANRRMCKEYFWFHKCFVDLYKVDTVFKDVWDSTVKISAGPPHFIQANGLCNPVTEKVKDHIRDKVTPMYKLSYGKLKHNSNISYILSLDIS